MIEVGALQGVLLDAGYDVEVEYLVDKDELIAELLKQGICVDDADHLAQRMLDVLEVRKIELGERVLTPLFGECRHTTIILYA